jgi:hypothetical protein
MYMKQALGAPEDLPAGLKSPEEIEAEIKAELKEPTGPGLWGAPTGAIKSAADAKKKAAARARLIKWGLVGGGALVGVIILGALWKKKGS